MESNPISPVRRDTNAPLTVPSNTQTVVETRSGATTFSVGVPSYINFPEPQQSDSIGTMSVSIEQEDIKNRHQCYHSVLIVGPDCSGPIRVPPGQHILRIGDGTAALKIRDIFQALNGKIDKNTQFILYGHGGRPSEGHRMKIGETALQTTEIIDLLKSIPCPDGSPKQSAGASPRWRGVVHIISCYSELAQLHMKTHLDGSMTVITHSDADHAEFAAPAVERIETVLRFNDAYRCDHDGAAPSAFHTFAHCIKTSSRSIALQNANVAIAHSPFDDPVFLGFKAPLEASFAKFKATLGKDVVGDAFDNCDIVVDLEHYKLDALGTQLLLNNTNYVLKYLDELEDDKLEDDKHECKEEKCRKLLLKPSPLKEMWGMWNDSHHGWEGHISAKGILEDCFSWYKTHAKTALALSKLVELNDLNKLHVTDKSGAEALDELKCVLRNDVENLKSRLLTIPLEDLKQFAYDKKCFAAEKILAKSIELVKMVRNESKAVNMRDMSDSQLLRAILHGGAMVDVESLLILAKERPAIISEVCQNCPIAVRQMALTLGAKRGMHDLVRTLLETPAIEIDKRLKIPNYGPTCPAIFHAARDSDPEMIRIFLDHGASINASSAEKAYPPLMAAVIHGNLDSVACLIKNGADLNWTDSDGNRIDDWIALRQDENGRVKIRAMFERSLNRV